MILKAIVVKRIIGLSAFFLMLLVACGENGGGAVAEEAPKDQLVAKGKMLVLSAENDCLACHAIADPMTGPAYRDVADRYKGDTSQIDMLEEKIIKGGTGNWGGAVMTPHPQLTEQDARLMVRYILSLKE